jgi:hypothetical protein
MGLRNRNALDNMTTRKKKILMIAVDRVRFKSVLRTIAGNPLEKTIWPGHGADDRPRTARGEADRRLELETNFNRTPTECP